MHAFYFICKFWRELRFLVYKYELLQLSVKVSRCICGCQNGRGIDTLFVGLTASFCYLVLAVVRSHVFANLVLSIQPKLRWFHEAVRERKFPDEWLTVFIAGWWVAVFLLMFSDVLLTALICVSESFWWRRMLYDVWREMLPFVLMAWTLKMTCLSCAFALLIFCTSCSG